MTRFLVSLKSGAVAGAIVASVWVPSPAAAQDSLQHVKTLYASAAYDDALAVLGRLQAVQRRPEYEQYRVFCLVALGRTVEAERAIASVVTEHPSFVPDLQETSPRIGEMFTRIRRALVPEIAQRMYLDARGALDRKDKAAESKFQALVQLIDSTPHQNADGEDDEPMLSELRLLATGFLDLSRAATVIAERRAEPAATRPPPPAPPEITSPVPVKQVLPVWVPPDQASQREFRGAVRVSISESGRVTDAELAPSIHPVYDRLLLQAARTWEYQPALRNGVPTPSEKVIEVVLRPR
jgi:TonB family protein